jgi:hypothetical protein
VCLWQLGRAVDQSCIFDLPLVSLSAVTDLNSFQELNSRLAAMDWPIPERCCSIALYLSSIVLQVFDLLNPPCLSCENSFLQLANLGGGKRICKL